MVIIVKSSNDYDSSYSSSSKAVGVFAYEQLFKLPIPVANVHESLYRIL